MVEASKAKDFSEAGIAPISIAGAIQRAREEVVRLTDLKVDAVTRVHRLPDGGWTVVMDLVESIARMGDNDLLATYELELDTTGTLVAMSRLARYRRENGS